MDISIEMYFNCRQALKEDPEMTMVIVQALYKESKKEAVEYRRHALQAFAMVLHELDIDRFKEVYDIAQEIWTTVCMISSMLNIVGSFATLLRKHCMP